jgi:hypothetical protein
MVAINTDIAFDYDQCNANPLTNMFKVTYFCGAGDDSVKIVSEPTTDKNGDCRFEFVVDSSVICDYYASSSSTGPDDSSSSSSPYVPPVETICSDVASSYTAPYDLSSSPTLTVSSENFPGGSYYIQTCGQIIVHSLTYSFISMMLLCENLFVHFNDVASAHGIVARI